MSEEQKTNVNQDASSNSFYTSATALQIRLNVEPLLAQLEMDIRGLREKWNPKTEEYDLVQVSDPMFSNELGIQNYLSYVRSVINTQVVQGNLDEDSYADFMESFHEGLASDLIINLHKYGLSVSHYNKAIRLATNMARGFLTRPISNKERDSYANTFKTVESSNTVAQNKGWFN